MPLHNAKVGVFCADDRALIHMALELEFSSRHRQYEWKGSLSSADELVETVERINRGAAKDGSAPVNVVILDVNMPGKCSFTAAAELVARFPGTRVVFFSGAPSPEDLARAQKVAPGSAWVAKGESTDPLLAAIAESSNATSA